MMLARLDMEIFSEVVILPAATSLSASFTFSMAACVKERGLKIQPANQFSKFHIFVYNVRPSELPESSLKRFYVS